MANGQAQDTSQKKEWKTRNKNRKRILSTRRCRPHRRRLCNYNNCRATRTIQHFRLKIVKSKYIFEILSRSLSLSLALSHFRYLTLALIIMIIICLFQCRRVCVLDSSKIGVAA